MLLFQPGIEANRHQSITRRPIVKIKFTANSGKAIRYPLVIAAVLALSLTAQAAEKASPRITSSTDIKLVAPLTDKEAESVSLAAGRVIIHAEKARLAIIEKKNKEALKQVDLGLKLIRIIENTMPKRKVTTHIQSGDITYDNEENIAQRYIPIYDEQYLEDIVTPVMQAKTGGHEKVARKNNSKKTNKKLALIGPEGDYSQWRHTSMKIDVVLAKKMLERAKKNLNAGKTADASVALIVLQDQGIIFRSFSVELPLVEAADNLKLAQMELNEKNHVEALATLKLASDDLKKYETLTGNSRSKDVRALYQEIDKLTGSIKDEKDTKVQMEKSGQQIASWWNRTVKWFKK